MKSTTSGAMIRTTFSLPSNQLQALEQIALFKKVSVSWVIRNAIDEYLEANSQAKSNEPVMAVKEGKHEF